MKICSIDAACYSSTALVSWTVLYNCSELCRTSEHWSRKLTDRYQKAPLDSQTHC